MTCGWQYDAICLMKITPPVDFFHLPYLTLPLRLKPHLIGTALPLPSILLAGSKAGHVGKWSKKANDGVLRSSFFFDRVQTVEAYVLGGFLAFPDLKPIQPLANHAQPRFLNGPLSNSCEMFAFVSNGGTAIKAFAAERNHNRLS